MAAPSWVDPNWQDDDIFSITPAEMWRFKMRVAAVTGLTLFAKRNPAAETASSTSGIQPFSINEVTPKIEAFNAKRNEYRADFSADDRATWDMELASLSQFSTVINGLQASWLPPNGPWNTGYITAFSEKIKSGAKPWDTSIERKAGGINVAEKIDWDSATFHLSNTASFVALLRLVLGEVMRTGRCPECYLQPFRSIRIIWFMAATKEELTTMSACENIEQHERKRHSEMDNIFQVSTWMKDMTAIAPQLDSTSCLDVTKFALLMGNPTKPGDIPPWLAPLLKKAQPSLKNKVKTILNFTITKQWLAQNHVKVQHPQLQTYDQIYLRVRAVLGFGEWELFHKLILEELGRNNMSHLPLPYTVGLLLDKNFYSSEAFSRKGDKDSVPLWLDGAQGKEMHKAMCEVFRRRLFDSGNLKQFTSGTKPVFKDGASWAAFARLNGPPDYHLTTVIDRQLPAPQSVAVEQLKRGIWVGDHDAAILAISNLMSPHIGSQTDKVHQVLLQQFEPLAHQVVARDTALHRMQQEKKEEEEAEKKKEAERQQVADAGQEEVSAPGIVEDGDVTDLLFNGQAREAKEKLCKRMNADAERKRNLDMRAAFGRAAAVIFRHKVVVVESIQEAKAWMETRTNDKLSCRIVFVDFTQFQSLSSVAEYSKVLNIGAPQAFQEALGDEVRMLPMTPCTGSLLVRVGSHPIDHFNIKASQWMGRERTIFIPIDVPPSYEKYLRSAARRALGLKGDLQERSGVEYQMRILGAKEQEGTGEEEEEGPEEGHDGPQEDEELAIENMSGKSIRKAFGRGTLEVMGALFQHTSKIGNQAKFLHKNERITTVDQHGKDKVFRKGQLHMTAPLAAMRSILASSATGLGSKECLVCIGGGTPEAAVAGVVLGFERVIFVTDDREKMTLPESDDATDYFKYEAPVDTPNAGILAAAAVRMLSPCVENHVLQQSAGEKLVPPHEIVLPPLQVYTFIPMTGRVLARTVHSLEVGWVLCTSQLSRVLQSNAISAIHAIYRVLQAPHI